MRNRIFTIFILLIFFQILNHGYAEFTDTGLYLKKNVVHKKLSNGINLIMLNRGYSPTLAFEISFRVGSVDESYQTIGAAHFLEHMLFKGTDRIGTSNFAKEKIIQKKIEAVGESLDRIRLINPGNSMIPELEKKLKRLQKSQSAYVISSPYDKIYTANGGIGHNASTSRDKTGYYIELPSTKLKLWAKLESERLRNPVLREYYLERNNVVEERLMRYDSSGTGSLFERFLAVAFMAHPYRHPIIGWRSNIPYLSIKDIRRFYWKHYIPSRMTITIVGKQDTDVTFRIIEKYFSNIRSRPEPPEIAVKEPPMCGERRFLLYFESNPFIIIGWHKPTFPSKDDYVFDVISEILAGGKSSRFYKALVLKKKILSSVSAWNGAPGGRYNNLFVVFSTPKSPNEPREVEKAVYGEIERFIKDVSAKEIRKVLNKMESSMLFDMDTNRGVARYLSYYQTIFGDWEYIVHYMNILKTISIKDIKSVSKKYFRKKNRIVGILYDSRKKENKSSE